MMRTAAVNQSTKKKNKNQNFFLFVSEHRCRDQLTTPTRSQSSEDEQNLETMQPIEKNLKEKLGIAGQFDGDQRKNVSRLTAVEWRGMQKKCETASGFGCGGVCFFRLYVASEGDKFKGERRARIRTQKGKVVGEKWNNWKRMDDNRVVRKGTLSLRSLSHLIQSGLRASYV